MNITYVVAIDLTPAVDQYGHLDDQAASEIAYQSSGWPEGATVRLNIGNARYGAPCKLLHVLESAGSVEITGIDPRGMRVVGDFLNDNAQYAVV